MDVEPWGQASRKLGRIHESNTRRIARAFFRFERVTGSIFSTCRGSRFRAPWTSWSLILTSIIITLSATSRGTHRPVHTRKRAGRRGRVTASSTDCTTSSLILTLIILTLPYVGVTRRGIFGVHAPAQQWMEGRPASRHSTSLILTLIITRYFFCGCDTVIFSRP